MEFLGTKKRRFVNPRAVSPPKPQSRRPARRPCALAALPGGRRPEDVASLPWEAPRRGKRGRPPHPERRRAAAPRPARAARSRAVRSGSQPRAAAAAAAAAPARPGAARGSAAGLGSAPRIRCGFCVRQPPPRRAASGRGRPAPPL